MSWATNSGAGRGGIERHFRFDNAQRGQRVGSDDDGIARRLLVVARTHTYSSVAPLREVPPCPESSPLPS